MRARAGALAILLALLAACDSAAAVPSGPPSASPTASPSPTPARLTRVSGSVRTTDGLPVAGVVVCLVACAADPVRTDERGEFAFDVPSGAFTWTVVYYRERDGERIEMDRQLVVNPAGDTHTLAPLVIRGR